MKVLVFDEQRDLEIATHSVKPVVKSVLTLEGKATDEVAVYFVKTEEMCRLHEEFFGDPSPTDCISFPMDEEQGGGYHVLGEVFVCPKTAIDYVLKSSEEVTEDVYREVSLYLVHGLLHLLGYEDKEEGDRAQMRAAEARHIDALIAGDLFLKKQ